MEHVQRQRQRSGLGRHVGAEQDAVDVRGCYRRVEALRHELQASVLQRCTVGRRAEYVLEQSAYRYLEKPGGAENGKPTDEKAANSTF